MPMVTATALVTPPEETVSEPATTLPTAHPPSNTVCDAA